ncbi:CHAT domain-containing protein [Desulfovibrio aerotolerans]|uniref:CHAT domain-containing protein n=1 Tax=Solidesulfovibrio aerotolerans TaxID=295255 RepID=A0A7C9IXL4_9BACT|nr:CHAT domain-containing protein [Solidesulfovibrio aerotolerans]MYL84262.1 CHAT domain-containing protein [Solidesulfovibrio aerotolerans]
MLRTYPKLAFVLCCWLLPGVVQASSCPEADAEKNTDKKIQLYTKCIESGKLSPYQASDAYCERGFVYGNSKILPKAIDDFTMCIKMRPTNPTGYLSRARAYIGMGTPEKAIPDIDLLMLAAANSPQVVSVRGDMHKAMKRYDDAITDYTRSIKLQKNSKSADKIEIADTYRKRSICHSEKKDWTSAQQDIDIAISLRPNDSKYYNTRGVLYSNQQNNDKAKEDFQQAVRLDPNNKSAQENLAQLNKSKPSEMDKLIRIEKESYDLVHKGEYSQAIEKLKLAMADSEKFFGDNLMGYSHIVELLAGMYDMTSQPNASLPLYKTLLQYYSELYGPNSSKAAPYIASLAGVYDEIGDAEQASKFRKRVVEIEEKSPDPSLQNLAGELHNLAMSELMNNEFEAAKKHLDKAYALKKRILGDDDLATIITQLGYAAYHKALGQDDQAEMIFQQQLILLKQLDPQHNEYIAEVYTDLADIRERAGDTESAERYLNQSLKIQQHGRGTSSTAVASAQQILANFSARRGDYKTALDLLLRSQRITDAFIDRVMGFTTERQQLLFLAEEQRVMQSLFSLVAQKFATDKAAIRQCFDIWLRLKGLVLETQKQFQNAILSSKDPKISHIFDELRTVRANISYSIFAGPSQDQSNEEHQKNLDSLEARKQALEAEIAQKSPSGSAGLNQIVAQSDVISRLLPKGSVMIEFVRTTLPSFELKTKTAPNEPPAHYLAFILPAGNPAGLTLVDLGEAARIETAQAELRRILSHPREAHPDDPDTAEVVTKASNALYKLVFSPLRQTLGEARKVFLSPDGALNLLPFEVLSDDAGRFLIEDFSFTYLAAGRDVLRFGRKGDKGAKNLVIGNPDFDLDAKTKQSVLQDLKLTRGAGPTDMMASRERRGLHFSPLPGTKQEIEAIQQILGSDNSEFYTGKAAVEELLMSRKAPNILHLATHGFFLPDQDMPRATSETPAEKKLLKERGTIFENPLVRSGIALAGANGSLTADKSMAGDGLVTAEKVLGLNLQGTKLVVLSACESGVGEIRSGEGVFGLRRAFMQAGAKSQIMSMWPVPDAQTKDLMTNFYTRLRTDAVNPAVALRQATLDMMEATRKQYGHANPFFWGAFVFLGDDGSITAPASKDVQLAAPQSDTARTSVARHEEIRRFMEDFFQARALNGSDRALDFYADQVDFFNVGKANKSIIKKSLDYYTNRWPIRNSSIISMSIDFNQQNNTYEIKISYDYSTKNSTLQKQGTAHDAFIIKQNGHKFGIVSEKNISTDRK